MQDNELQRAFEALFVAVAGVFTAFGGCLSTGCVTTLTDNGQLGLRFGTDIAFYHNAAETNSEASSEFNMGGAFDMIKWMFPPKPEAPTPAPVPVTPASHTESPPLHPLRVYDACLARLDYLEGRVRNLEALRPELLAAQYGPQVE